MFVAYLHFCSLSDFFNSQSALSPIEIAINYTRWQLLGFLGAAAIRLSMLTDFFVVE